MCKNNSRDIDTARPTTANFAHWPINYGKKSDEIIIEEASSPVGKKEEQYICQVVGSLLQFAKAIDLTILPALSDIAAEQSKPMERTLKRVSQLLLPIY